MGKIHVLLRKEDLDTSRIDDHVVVVIDVLLATSTIATALFHGAKEVIPVMDEAEALTAVQNLENDSYFLVGEKDGYTLKGFHGPSPNQLIKKNIHGKSIILSTTNGTVAIRKSSNAKKIFTSSLLNGKSLAARLAQEYWEDTVIIVCSGSGGQFSLEDFYGAGYLVSQMLAQSTADWELTDSTRAALGFYQHSAQGSEQCLTESRVGQFIVQLGYADDIRFVSNEGLLAVVPELVDGRLIG